MVKYKAAVAAAATQGGGDGFGAEHDGAHEMLDPFALQWLADLRAPLVQLEKSIRDSRSVDAESIAASVQAAFDEVDATTAVHVFESALDHTRPPNEFALQLGTAVMRCFQDAAGPINMHEAFGAAQHMRALKVIGDALSRHAWVGRATVRRIWELLFSLESPVATMPCTNLDMDTTVDMVTAAATLVALCAAEGASASFSDDVRSFFAPSNVFMSSPQEYDNMAAFCHAVVTISGAVEHRGNADDLFRLFKRHNDFFTTREAYRRIPFGVQCWSTAQGSVDVSHGDNHDCAQATMVDNDNCDGDEEEDIGMHIAHVIAMELGVESGADELSVAQRVCFVRSELRFRVVAFDATVSPPHEILLRAAEALLEKVVVRSSDLVSRRRTLNSAAIIPILDELAVDVRREAPSTGAGGGCGVHWVELLLQSRLPAVCARLPHTALRGATIEALSHEAVQLILQLDPTVLLPLPRCASHGEDVELRSAFSTTEFVEAFQRTANTFVAAAVGSGLVCRSNGLLATPVVAHVVHAAAAACREKRSGQSMDANCMLETLMSACPAVLLASLWASMPPHVVLRVFPVGSLTRQRARWLVALATGTSVDTNSPPAFPSAAAVGRALFALIAQLVDRDGQAAAWQRCAVGLTESGQRVLDDALVVAFDCAILRLDDELYARVRCDGGGRCSATVDVWMSAVVNMITVRPSLVAVLDTPTEPLSGAIADCIAEHRSTVTAPTTVTATTTPSAAVASVATGADSRCRAVLFFGVLRRCTPLLLDTIMRERASKQLVLRHIVALLGNPRYARCCVGCIMHPSDVQIMSAPSLCLLNSLLGAKSDKCVCLFVFHPIVCC